MHTVELYTKVRRSVIIDKMSSRTAARHYCLSCNTVAKILKHDVPQGYRRKDKPTSPKLDGYTAIIDQIISNDKSKMLLFYFYDELRII